MRNRVRGGKLEVVVGQDILAIEEENERQIIVQQVMIENIGDREIKVKINKGDSIPVEAGETLSLGDIPVSTIEVVEGTGMLRWIAVEK